jgi:hypothetical protein
MMKPNTTGRHPDIPYISLCGKETNYMTPLDPIAPWVFTSARASLSKESDWAEDDVEALEQQLLEGVYVGHSSLRQPFDPSLLSYCQESGRLYLKITHPIPNKHLINTNAMGLLHPLICQAIVMGGLLEIEEGCQGGDTRENRAALMWKGKRYKVNII